ncbi:MAG TPA: hypothetical protein VFF86_02235 [Candidatus Methylomirabilis sp.]|nr:hypothetical protein [Candidatus Methylomirabilis sp.]
MELFGILFAIPAAFIAAAIYARLIRVVLRYRLITRISLWLSGVVLVGLLVEWGALVTVGAVRSRAIIGPTFYPIHLVLLLFALPALANILIVTKGDTMLGSWFMVAFLCSVLAVPVVLTQYGVAEALYGIDGAGGPYGQAPTIPMPGWW